MFFDSKSLEKNLPLWYIIEQFCFLKHLLLLKKSVIFRQVREKPTKFHYVFAITSGEMSPGGLCLHIPFRALLHMVMVGSWSDLSRNIGKRSVFSFQTSSCCWQQCKASFFCCDCKVIKVIKVFRISWAFGCKTVFLTVTFQAAASSKLYCSLRMPIPFLGKWLWNYLFYNYCGE